MRFTPEGAQTTHPQYCDHTRCTHYGPNLHHRSRPAEFLPRQHGVTEVRAVAVSIERLDEIDEDTGRQIEHPAEVVLAYDDGRQVRWGVEDFREIADMALGLSEHGGCFSVAS